MQTQAQKFAAVYASKLAKRQLRAITALGVLAKLITFGVAAISYRHQSTTLVGWNAPTEIAYGLPALVDLLTIACVIGISTPAMVAKARYWSSRVIVIPILISGSINVAGDGKWGVKLAALSLPVLIPLAELIASHFKPDFAEMDRIERAAYAVATPAAEIEVDEAERERRSEAARKAAETRKANAKAAAEAKAERAERARKAREARKLQELEDMANGFTPVPAGA